MPDLPDAPALSRAADFPPEVLALFDRYVHGGIDRGRFLAEAAEYAAPGRTAEDYLAALSPRFGAARKVSPDDPRLTARFAEYPSPLGYGTARGYLVRPAAASGRLGTVLLIHENRGLNPHIEDVARRLALEGFLVLAPDALFPLGGYPGDEDAARELFKGLDQAKAREDFLAAAAFAAALPESNGRLGAVGFCYGGGIANFLATRLPELRAAVPFYGGAPDPADVPRIRAPLLIHLAAVDERINAAWPAYEAALRAAGADYRAFTYPGTQHGFHNDTTPRYDEAAADLAWGRTVSLLRSRLS